MFSGIFSGTDFLRHESVIMSLTWSMGNRAPFSMKRSGLGPLGHEPPERPYHDHRLSAGRWVPQLQQSLREQRAEPGAPELGGREDRRTDRVPLTGAVPGELRKDFVMTFPTTASPSPTKLKRTRCDKRLKSFTRICLWVEVSFSIFNSRNGLVANR